MKRKETLLGQLDREDDSPLPAPDFPPGQKYGLLAVSAAGILFIAYLLLGIFFAPWLIRKQVLEPLVERHQLNARVGGVGFNPLTLTCSLNEVELLDADSQPVLLAEVLRVNLQISTLFKPGMVLNGIHAESPELYLTRLEDGSLNLYRILAGDGEQVGSGSDKSVESAFHLPRVSVKRTRIRDGRIHLLDRRNAVPFTETIDPINLSLKNLNTTGLHGSELQISGEGESGFRFEMKGHLTSAPFSLECRVALQGLVIAHFQPYFEERVDFHVDDGAMDSTFRVVFDSNSASRSLVLDEGSLRIFSSSIRTEAGQLDTIKTTDLELDGIWVDFMQKRVQAGELRVSGGDLTLVRKPDEAFNLTHLIAIAKRLSGDSEPSTTPEAEKWDVQIESLNFQDIVIYSVDPAMDSVPVSEIIVETLMGSRTETRDGEEYQLEGKCRVGESGQVRLDGNLSPAPFNLNLDIESEDVPVRLIEPYLERALRMDIASGELDMNGTIRVDGETSPARFALNGSAVIQNLESKQEQFPEGKLQMDRMVMDGVVVETHPMRFNARKLTTQGLTGTYLKLQDGRWLSPYQSPDKPGIPVKGNPMQGRENGEPAVRIETVVIEDSSLTLLDRSASPTFRSSLTEVSGRITGISSRVTDRAAIQLDGKLNHDGIWRAEGEGNLFHFRDDLRMNLNLEPTGITFLSTYSGKYFGRRLERGDVDLTLDYAIRDDELNGKNRLRFTNLGLGTTVDSGDAVLNFPLELAVSILKNREGVLNIEFPLSGRLNDPNFQMGGLFVRAISSVLAKAAASPFTLLESLVGARETLSYVQFKPGEWELSGDARSKLDQLVEVMRLRPELDMELHGRYDAERDRYALQMQALQERLKKIQEHDPQAPQQDIEEASYHYRMLLDYAHTHYDKEMMEMDGSNQLDEPDEEQHNRAMRESDTLDVEDQDPVELELEFGRVERTPGPWGRIFGRGQPVTEGPESVIVTGRKVGGGQGESPPPENSVDQIPGDVILEFPEELPPEGVLEEQLLSRITVDGAGLMDLAQKRVETVRNYMADNGGIDRARLEASNSVDTGSARVNFVPVD